VEYRDGKPFRVDCVVIFDAAQRHRAYEDLRHAIMEHVIKPIVPRTCGTQKPNNTSTDGRFVMAGRWAMPA